MYELDFKSSKNDQGLNNKSQLVIKMNRSGQKTNVGSSEYTSIKTLFFCLAMLTLYCTSYLQYVGHISNNCAN